MVSIIIPVYNVENYVGACLDTVIQQTYSDLELIVIDDGSTDGSGKISMEYAVKDSRIRYIKTENHGLSEARNQGLKLCSGEYISFVDSDDRLHPQAIEFMLKALKEKHVPFVKSGFCKIADKENPSFSELKYDTLPIIVQTCVSEIKNSFSNALLRTVWGGLYTKDCISGQSFEKGRLMEDVMFSSRILTQNQRMARIDAPLYQYRIRSSSISHLKKTGKADIDRMEVRIQLIELLNETNPELQELAKEELLTVCSKCQIRVWSQGSEPGYDKSIQETIKKCVKLAHPNFRIILNRDIPLRKKLFCFGCMISFTATCRLKQLALYIINR